METCVAVSRKLDVRYPRLQVMSNYASAICFNVRLRIGLPRGHLETTGSELRLRERVSAFNCQGTNNITGTLGHTKRYLNIPSIVDYYGCDLGAAESFGLIRRQ